MAYHPKKYESERCKDIAHELVEVKQVLTLLALPTFVTRVNSAILRLEDRASDAFTEYENEMAKENN